MSNNPTIADGFDPTITPLGWVSPTLSDTVDEAQMFRGVRCQSINGTPGTISYSDYFGITRTDEISKGETLMAFIRRINVTGTSAAGLKGAL
jgi:hypothetical protein